MSTTSRTSTKNLHNNESPNNHFNSYYEPRRGHFQNCGQKPNFHEPSYDDEEQEIEDEENTQDINIHDDENQTNFQINASKSEPELDMYISCGAAYIEISDPPLKLLVEVAVDRF